MFEGMFWEFDREYALMVNLADVTQGANKFTDFQTKFGVVAGIDKLSGKVSDDISQGACGESKFNKFWDAFSLAFTRFTMAQHESRYLTNGVWTKPVTALISVPINKTATDTDDLEESYFFHTEVAAMKTWSDDMGVAAPSILLLNLRENCDAIEQVFAIGFPDVSVACKYCTGGGLDKLRSRCVFATARGISSCVFLVLLQFLAKADPLDVQVRSSHLLRLLTHKFVSLHSYAF